MDKSPTDSGTDQSSSDSREESLLDKNQQPSADEQHQDAVSGANTSDADQDSQDASSQGGTTSKSEDNSSDDDGLARFAKSQGFDPDNLTDGERKALKLAHDNQKAYRNKTQETSEELKTTVQDAYSVTDEELDDEDPAVAENLKTRAEVAQLRAENRLTNFLSDNPEAREYQDDMRDILLDVIETEGKEAARALASTPKGLRRLLAIAKEERGGTEAAREAGRREEREELRRRQEAGGDAAPAARTSGSGTKKYSRQDIANMSDDEYEQFRKSGELDAAIARGDLY